MILSSFVSHYYHDSCLNITISIALYITLLSPLFIVYRTAPRDLKADFVPNNADELNDKNIAGADREVIKSSIVVVSG